MEELKSNFSNNLRNVKKTEIQETGEAIYTIPLSEQQNAKSTNFECSGFVYKNEVQKGSSKSAQYRQRMKAENPKMYAEFLENKKIQARKIRERRKEKWKNEPHTRALVKQHERENELSRLRMRKFRSKGAPEKMTKNSKTVEANSKKPRDMTEKEKKEHIRRLQQECRARQTAEKKQEIKEKDRAYQKAKRAGLTQEEVTNITMEELKSNFTQEVRNEKKQEIQETGELILECDEDVTNITMEELKSNCTQELINEIKQEIQETDEAIYSTPLSEQQNAKRKYFKWSGFVYKNEVEKGSSQSAQYRQRMKAENPKKYAEYLESQKKKVKKIRDRRKEKWKNEPHNQALVEQYKRENELSRLRMRKFRSKGAPEKMTKNSQIVEANSKKPRDMTEKEKKEHNRRLQQECRARQTAEKKQERREKDRAYQKAKHARFIQEEVTNITMEELKSNFTQEVRNEKKQEIQETGELILECDEEVTNLTLEELKSNFTQELINEIKQEIQETDEAIYSTPLSEQQKAKRKYFKWSSFVHKNEVEKGSSRSAQYKRKIKLENPKKYAEFLENKKIKTRQYRERRKEKWKNEPHNQALIEQHERENELSRLRMRKYRSKCAAEKMTKSKKPNDMTEKEKKEHIRRLKRECRARRTAEKIQEIKEKDRVYQKARRAGLIKVKILKTPKQEP